MNTYTEVEWLCESVADPAESPLWDAQRGVLWWVDIMDGALHRFDPETRNDAVIRFERPLGTVGLRTDGGLVAGFDNGVSLIDPDSGEVDHLVDVEADVASTRANEGKPGPDGHFWFGSMTLDVTQGKGAFYRVSPAGEVQTLLTEVSVSNGLDWETETTFLYIDSMLHRIERLEFDPVAGQIVDRSTVVEIDPSDGVPDGLTLDTEGAIWVALYGGSGVRRYSADGELIGRVDVPASLTTSCAFGGNDLCELYITAASHEGRGGLLRCEVDVAGREPFRFGQS